MNDSTSLSILFFFKKFLLMKSFFVIFFCHTVQDVRACGILVPQPGIQPRPSALRAQNLNHWTTWEVPTPVLLIQFVSDGQ